MLENFRKTQLIWDKASTKIKDYLRANSSDNHGRKLSVTVTDDGRVVDLTGVSLMLYRESQDKKVNGLDSFTAVHAQTGQFEIYYTPELLSNVGDLNAQLVLIVVQVEWLVKLLKFEFLKVLMMGLLLDRLVLLR
ncbi:BppU family phage baseplate upper protein [Fundicoccus ignavus]|uniref:BppU family phage baseplate upper protein n=1 Tax=Fundicoccus ignavus TaxID=2664442 RepID=UPI00129C787F|nr:BppU family phage baseplate upper protein [Fundicoccus ignavus]